MTNPSPGRQGELRALVSGFLAERLSTKLEGLAEDDPKRDQLEKQFTQANWLEDAARRVAQIHAVTHSLKPAHPDAKGSSLYRAPSSLTQYADLVGTHNLGENFDLDVVGNAAALDVYKFLKLSHEDRTLLDLAVDSDADLARALGADAKETKAWMAAFASMLAAPDVVSTHTNAKQIYWPVDDDRLDDTSYHLLAPLYPTSLIQKLYLALTDDRFGDEAKEARKARRNEAMHERPVRDYPDLTIQKLGGTKPQNISQLNSERRGDNYLLASLPPLWKTVDILPVHGFKSMFRRFERRTVVKKAAWAFRRFLEEDRTNNIKAKMRSAEFVDALIDELLHFTYEIRSLESGWSNLPECLLTQAQKTWLDAHEEQPLNDDAAETVAIDFANWLNARLRHKLPVGDDEFAAWKTRVIDEFKRDAREGGDVF